MSIPNSMGDRGPVPGASPIVVSLLAQESMDENTLVTFGTVNGSCKKAGATDFMLGWTQGNVVINKTASIHLFAPQWKAQVAATSDSVVFGDTLELAGSGKVKRAVTGSGRTIAGMAMNDAEADGFVLFIPVVCCPSADYSE